MGWFFTALYLLNGEPAEPKKMGPFETQQQCETAKLRMTARMPVQATPCTRERTAPGTRYVQPGPR